MRKSFHLFFPLPTPVEQHLSLLDIGKEWNNEAHMSSAATWVGDTGYAQQLCW